MTLTTGKVVRFDEYKGYGFVAPDSGGEDVFIHVNDLTFDKSHVTPGLRVQFEIEDGERGLKASRVRLPESEARRAAPMSATKPVDDDMCDVLSEPEFLEEVTEIMLRAAPAMTAGQIVAVREELTRAARARGWVTG
ncbi:cold-shock DNA-binding protein family [Amycolatopsis marina]|uniref:Cold-shock DNA-binding protein family n=1 Tax=Amycolatopsis marina TaxID=490629 RepID=A0A1I1AQQ3_9PSEU|nr:cold shock domain-containing protein [Amycolatopsis marina]SFB40365.1 cold-shock DNA-binding protein family [Amycolatopsis marina]